jgi:hypothetical protein
MQLFHFHAKYTPETVAGHVFNTSTQLQFQFGQHRALSKTNQTVSCPHALLSTCRFGDVTCILAKLSWRPGGNIEGVHLNGFGDIVGSEMKE